MLVIIGALSLTSSIVMVTFADVFAVGAESNTGTGLLALIIRMNDGFCSRSVGLATVMIPSDILKNLKKSR